MDELILPRWEELRRSLRVISLGAGVQSSTLLLMALEGGIPPVVAAIFADTQWEPKAVYAHLDFLTELAARHGVPIYRVTMGDLRQDTLRSDRTRCSSLPLFVKNPDGEQGRLHRQCTGDYKVVPVRRKVSDLLMGRVRGAQVEMLLGISYDEIERMKGSRVQYVTHSYPLVDLQMTREGCVTWLTERGHPIPPKSACIGCPYHDNVFWRELRDNSPSEFMDAVMFDEAIRTGLEGKGVKGEAFLHRSMLPLRVVDLDVDTHALFGEECEGHCGL